MKINIKLYIKQYHFYFYNHIVHYIYQYVTGYSFDISIQNKKELHMSIECYDCFGNKEMIETLSMDNSYNIIYKKIAHDFGKMYILEFECLECTFGLARVCGSDCRDDDFTKHAVVIKDILNYYNCSYDNFKKLFVAVEDTDVGSVGRQIIEANIIYQCQTMINEKIRGFKRHMNESSPAPGTGDMDNLMTFLQYLRFLVYCIDDDSISS
eukprot:249061_1